MQFEYNICCFRYERYTRSVSIGTNLPEIFYFCFFFENYAFADCALLMFTFFLFSRAVPPAYYAHLLAYRARHFIEGDYSDGDSSTGPKAGVAGGVRFRALPEIKQNVKDVMFYC